MEFCVERETMTREARLMSAWRPIHGIKMDKGTVLSFSHDLDLTEENPQYVPDDAA